MLVDLFCKVIAIAMMAGMFYGVYRFFKSFEDPNDYEWHNSYFGC